MKTNHYIRVAFRQNGEKITMSVTAERWREMFVFSALDGPDGFPYTWPARVPATPAFFIP